MASHAQSIEIGLVNTSALSVEPTVIPEIVEDKLLRHHYRKLQDIIDSELSQSEKQNRLIAAINDVPFTHFFTVLTDVSTWLDEKELELMDREGEDSNLEMVHGLKQIINSNLMSQIKGMEAEKLIAAHNAINALQNNPHLDLKVKQFLVMLGMVLAIIATMLAIQAYKSEQDKEREASLGMKAEFNIGEDDILADLEA